MFTQQGNGLNTDDFDTMTALGVSQDCPDLDELIDIGDTHSGSQTHIPCSVGSFQTNDCVEILDWYSDTSEITQQQYESQIEFEVSLLCIMCSLCELFFFNGIY